MNRLREAVAWQVERMRDHASEDVTYHRPGFGSSRMRASFAERTEQEETTKGATVYTKKPQFVIAASEMQIAGAPIVPIRGDRIVYIDVNENAITYEIASTTSTDNSRFGLSYRISVVAISVLTPALRGPES